MALGASGRLLTLQPPAPQIILVALTLALVLFYNLSGSFRSWVRQLGTSILASAGIAGIILGFAAQRTLGNLLAGIQIALSQPILIDDVVIVEGEFGRIEDITLTFVAVRTWDLRRLMSRSLILSRSRSNIGAANRIRSSARFFFISIIGRR